VALEVPSFSQWAYRTAYCGGGGYIEPGRGQAGYDFANFDTGKVATFLFILFSYPQKLGIQVFAQNGINVIWHILELGYTKLNINDFRKYKVGQQFSPFLSFYSPFL
jgi:hypothetical protein